MSKDSPHLTARVDGSCDDCGSFHGVVTRVPKEMSDDAILDELVETVRLARSHGTWDRERLRAVSAEIRTRELLPGLALIDPASART